MSALSTPIRSGGTLARVGLPVVLIGAVLTMVVPIPSVLLDVLLAMNITLAIVVMLAALTMRDTLELSAFPSLILIATVMRLALNVSSTRLVLLDGYAGKVIQTFGDFVIGGSIVVGLVVFLILMVIQFAVVTSGSGRVAEVGARFALDAMPGKQMAIDADLSAGLIDDREARTRRERVAQESDFYGAMDGASKFVKGDAIAAIVIVLINLLGGFTIGVVSLGMPFGEAASTYALLTVGDGLVSAIPALLLSVSTGLVVSRVNSEKDLGPQLGEQLLRNRSALRIGGVVVAAMALLPGLPKLVFLLLGGGLFLLANRVVDRPEVGAESEEERVVRADPDDPEALIGQMRLEPLELHLSYDVLDLIDPQRGGDLLDRVKSLRAQMALDLGLVMPLVRTRDDVSLPSGAYRILLHGVEVAAGEAPRDRVLALPAGDHLDTAGVPAEETVEPVFGLRAYWVPAEARSTLLSTGATVVDRSSVIVTHLAEVVREHAGDLLSRQQVQQLVEGLRYDEPLLASEVGTESLPLSLLHEVLRGLLAERVPVRDLARIVEAVSHAAHETRGIEALVARARVALGPSILARIAPDRRLRVVALAPELEASLHESMRDIDGTLQLLVDPARTAAIVEQLESAAASPPPGDPLAVVCGQMLRGPLQRLLSASQTGVSVLAYPELPNTLELTPIGAITDAHVDA